MQPSLLVRGLQVDDFPDDRLSIRGIFLHRQNWERYAFTHRQELRTVEVEEARKLLSCHGPEKGCVYYSCPSCHHFHTVTFGCNSRLCTRCGKPHADKWATDLRKSILPLPHRHLTFTLPQELRPLIRAHRGPLMKAMMDATFATLDEALSNIIRGAARKQGGAIAVVHPFGRDLEFKPHVHVICLEGAFVGKTFVPKTYFPMDLFRQTWQYQVLTAIRAHLKEADPSTLPQIDQAFTKYPKGFYVHVTQETRINDPDKVLRYVGRYVRHPAVAESRLVGYDGTHVSFKWDDHATKAEKHRTLTVDEFMAALIQHVPERHFKMVRHYGVYSRSLKRLFRSLGEQWSIAQSTLGRFARPKGLPKTLACPKCGQPMDFVLYDRPPPGQPLPFGSTLPDWNQLTASGA